MSAGAHIIWILFGNMHNFEDIIPKLRNTYARYHGVLQKKGYTLGTPQATSKHGFLNLVSDSATAGIVWHSHGVYNSFGEPLGYLAGKNNETIKPGDVRSPSQNLAFAALLGCAIGIKKHRWQTALGLNRFGDADRRLAVSGDLVTFWDRNIGSRKVKSFPRSYAEGLLSNPKMPYDFSDLIDKLPSLE